MLNPPRRTAALIRSDFESLGYGVLRAEELRALFERRKVDWGFSRFTSFSEFVDYATAKLALASTRVLFPDRAFDAYIWESLDPHEVWRAIDPDAFLSHYSALQLHALTDDAPKIIYVSTPTRPRRESPRLTQDQVFAGMQGAPRETTARCKLGDFEVVRLNQHLPDSALAEAITRFEAPPTHQVSSIENVLLQAVMRPDYCGGLTNVVEAFRRAKQDMSTNRLLRLLRKTKYSYPYAQALGFLMSRTGHDLRVQTLLRSEVTDLRFFLIRGDRSSMLYDETWKLYYPKIMDELTNGPTS